MMNIAVNYTVTESTRSNKAVLTLLKDDLTGRETEKFLIDRFRVFQIGVARATLEDEQKKGFDKQPRQVTDNRLDKPDYTVKPFGKIEYISRLKILDSLVSMYSEILRVSKVVSGTYRKWNVVFLNGKVIAGDLPTLQKWVKTAKVADGDLIQFVNLNAYARRLEYLGVSAGKSSRRRVKNMKSHGKGRKPTQSGTRPMKNAPNGTYYLAHKMIMKNFKIVGAEKPKFEFVKGQIFGGLPVAGQRDSYIQRPGNKWAGMKYLYPCISFKISSRGTI